MSRLKIEQSQGGSWLRLLRRYPRVKLEATVAVAVDGKAVLAQAHDVGEGGIGIELPHLLPAIPPPELGFERVLVVSSASQGADELKAYIRSGRAPTIGDGRIEKTLAESGFRIERSETLVALVATKVVWMTRAR